MRRQLSLSGLVAQHARNLAAQVIAVSITLGAVHQWIWQFSMHL